MQEVQLSDIDEDQVELGSGPLGYFERPEFIQQEDRRSLQLVFVWDSAVPGWIDGRLAINLIILNVWLVCLFILKFFIILDPVEEVEDRVQALIKDLEEMLGESLQSHFV